MEENNQGSNIPKEPTKKEKAQQAGKDVAEVAAKGAANYFGGPVGGAIADKVIQSKTGQKVLNTAGKTLSRNPMTKNTLAKAQPAISQAKPLLNSAASGLNGAPGTNASNSANSLNQAQKNTSPNTSPSTNNQTNNSSNSGFGNNKSGLFSNSKEPNNNKSSSQELMGTFKKAKTVMTIISMILPIILPALLILLVVFCVMAQIMAVRDNIVKLASQFTTGIEKFINFSEGDGWRTNEESFFYQLNKEYNQFPQTTDGGSLDVPLIAATIHYSKLVDLNQFEVSDPVEDTNYSSQNFESLGGFLSESQTVAFYRIAKDKMGSVNSKIPGQKRLLGHLVKTEITMELTDFSTALNNWSQFFNYAGQTVDSSFKDVREMLPVGDIVSPLSAIATFYKIYQSFEGYAIQTGNPLAGLQYDAANLQYEFNEFVYNVMTMFDPINSNVDQGTDENGNTVYTEKNSGWFPAPKITRTMNYGHDEYKQMKSDLLKIKAILKKSGEDISDDQKVIEIAKNSSNEELKNLYKSYHENERIYMYSYTHYLNELYVPFNYFYDHKLDNGEGGLKTYTTAQVDTIVEEIYQQRDFYYYLIDESKLNTCSGNCSYTVDGNNITDLKVRLLQGSDENLGKPIPGEELVDFEKYILGVVYAEIGPSPGTEKGLNQAQSAEIAKAQAIAARSFALMRAKAMGGSGGITLKQENGEWILSIRNCTEDQVYCDPDVGCSAKKTPTATGVTTTMYSGANKHSHKYKDPLPEDAIIRTAVAEVSGKVLLDGKGNILLTGYTDASYYNWINLAKKGYDYTDILLTHYSDIYASSISASNCNQVCNAASGDYTQWKQLASLGAPWADVVIGNGQTINNVGCLVTSVAIQIARSGVPVNIKNFNPGTFVEAIKPDGFQGAAFVWSSTTKVAPTFVYQDSAFTSLRGLTKAQKASRVKGLIDDGCYVIMEVKDGYGGSDHYVAVDYVQGDEVYMMDPASTSTVTWDQYHYSWTSGAYCYKVAG